MRIGGQSEAKGKFSRAGRFSHTARNRVLKVFAVGALALSAFGAMVGVMQPSVAAAAGVNDVVVNLHNYNPSGQNGGINHGHNLKFGTGQNLDSYANNNPNQDYNRWTGLWTLGSTRVGLGGNDGAYQGIVQSNLGEGSAPVTAEDKGNESLSYLFSTGHNNNTCRDYANVTGLLTEGTDGYIYYDSDNQSARLNTNTGKINLGSENGGFYPFGTDDYFFGMDISAGFVMPKDGLVNNQHTVFNFSGDDDVWVFIDGHLVLDIGGVHAATSGSIDFATGKVTVSNVYGETETGRPITSVTPQNTTLAAMFQAALEDEYGGNAERVKDEMDALFNKDAAGNYTTFKDYSNHTLRFFYLERGASESNCSIRFNLQTLPPDQFYVAKEITDTNTADFSDAEFTMYVETKGVDDNGFTSYEGSYTIYDRTSYLDNLDNPENAEVISNDSTNNGRITLKHNQLAVLKGSGTNPIDGDTQYRVAEIAVSGYPADDYTFEVDRTGFVDETGGDWVDKANDESVIGKTTSIRVGDVPGITVQNRFTKNNKYAVTIAKVMKGSSSTDTFTVKVTDDEGNPYTGAYYVRNTGDTSWPAEGLKTNNGTIKLQAGQEAGIFDVVPDASFKVSEQLTGEQASQYKTPTYAYTGSGTPTQGSDGISFNVGHSTESSAPSTVTITNTKVIEPIELTENMDFHKYVDAKDDGTYDLSLDVHGKVDSQTEEKKLDIVYVLDLSYSMMWDMDGSYPGGEDNQGGDDEDYADQYTFVRYNAAIDAIKQLDTALESSNAITARAALVTFASGVKYTSNGFSDLDSFEKELPQAQWSSFESGTNYGAALNKAKELINNDSSGAEKVVIFISDGEPNRNAFDSTHTVDASKGIKFAIDQMDGLDSNWFYAVGVGKDDFDQYLGDLVDKAQKEGVSKSQSGFYKGTSAEDLATYFSTIASNLTSTVGVGNATITDTLSNYAQLTNNAQFKLTITGDGQTFTGSVSAKDVSAQGEAHVDVASNGDTEVTATVKYDSSTKTFVVSFPSSYILKNGWIYTVTINIEPTTDAYKQYASNGYTDTGDKNTDYNPDGDVTNHTSSDEKGFFCNTEANLTYVSGGESKTKEYPKPVIQVDDKFNVRIYKVDSDGSGSEIPLEGAIFTLFKDANNDGVPDEDELDGEPFKSVTTGSNGLGTFANLAPGTYWLTEQTAPTGNDGSSYQKSPNVWKIVVGFDENTGSRIAKIFYPTIEEDGFAYSDDDAHCQPIKMASDGVYQITIANHKVLNLPKTGSSGTVALFAGGIATATVAGIYLISKLRAIQ